MSIIWLVALNISQLERKKVFFLLIKWKTVNWAKLITSAEPSQTGKQVLTQLQGIVSPTCIFCKFSVMVCFLLLKWRSESYWPQIIFCGSNCIVLPVRPQPERFQLLALLQLQSVRENSCFVWPCWVACLPCLPLSSPRQLVNAVVIEKRSSLEKAESESVMDTQWWHKI